MARTLIDERQPVREMVARRMLKAAWGADARLERAPALDRERFRNHAEALLVELEDAGLLASAAVAADTTDTTR
jgi:hypothetical protein